MTRKQTASLFFLGASLLYNLLPVDFIPDIPLIGRLDDVLVTSSAAMNCIEQFSGSDNEVAKRVMRWLKWVCLLLAVLIILVFLLIAGTLYAAFS